RVRIETRARNRIAQFPDASGCRPAAHTIASHPDVQCNPLPIVRLLNAARTVGVAAAPSRNAGAYLCNYLYWRALEAAAAPEGPGLVIFIHVPPIRLKNLPKKRPATNPLKKRPLPKHRIPHLNDLIRAGEAIMIAMTSLAAGRRP